MSAAVEYDSPWKEAIRLYLRSFLRLCFPELEKLIDWSRQPHFLDKELQRITRDAQSGTRFVDVLVKVWLLDGAEEWILFHLEVQHWPDPKFPERCYHYNVLAFEVHRRPVATLAILADADPNWRPSFYQREAPGTTVRIDFSVCKLLDLVADEAVLRASREPAAIVVLANWAVQQAGNDDQRRLALKWDLTRRLYEIGFEKADILELYRLIDWLLKLPKELEDQFLKQVYAFEAKTAMPYITSAERFGIEQGIEKGIEQGIEKGIEQGIEKGIEQGQVLACRESILTVLKARFRAVPRAVSRVVNAEAELARLRRWLRLAGTCRTLKDFKIS